MQVLCLVKKGIIDAVLSPLFLAGYQQYSRKLESFQLSRIQSRYLCGDFMLNNGQLVIEILYYLTVRNCLANVQRN